ncbi:MAG TPA: hypothetical protein VKB77_03135 [Terriglobales bacterium]|nr:hypothetical protein [Terriglobales bacterium]
MRMIRVAVALLLVGVGLEAQTDVQKVTVMGKLTRVMTIGGESTGWAIEIESPPNMEGKDLHSIELAYKKTAKLEKLVNQRVAATGKIVHHQGVETGGRVVLEATSIREAKQ